MVQQSAFEVSVTIPVYNAAEFVRRAVESALSQLQTAEVILVEDYSPDNSWQVCQQLASEYDKVRLYRHPDGKNHGCAASRTLAAQKSTCEYVAFLDADDYYLQDRFEVSEKLLKNDPRIDGVYEAVGMQVEDDFSRQRWLSAGKPIVELETITEKIQPERLFDALVLGGKGHFHINGLVLRRKVIEKAGYFDNALALHMDEVMFIKLAALAKLVPGRLSEPVAMWRVHGRNRFSVQRPKNVIYKMRLRFWNTVWSWGCAHLNQVQQELIAQTFIKEACNRTRFNKPFPRFLYGLQRRVQWFLLPFSYPWVLKERAFWSVVLLHPSAWLQRIQTNEE
jgi:glycosyltransferase involved in cell wall biosynthesis